MSPRVSLRSGKSRQIYLCIDSIQGYEIDWLE